MNDPETYPKSVHEDGIATAVATSQGIPSFRPDSRGADFDFFSIAIIGSSHLTFFTALGNDRYSRTAVTGVSTPILTLVQQGPAPGRKRSSGGGGDGMRTRPISSANVTATKIMVVSAAPEKMSPRSVSPKMATGSVTHPGG